MKIEDYKGMLGLQMFADGNEDEMNKNGSSTEGGAEGGGGNDDKSAQNTKASKSKEKSDFEDFLSVPKNQAEFNRRVAEALSTQKAKLDGEYRTSLEDAKKEAEKLAKMNADQKRQYEEEKKDQLIAEQKAEIDKLKHEALRAELSKEAARIMKTDHSIVATQDMLDFVVGDDADTTRANISKLVGIIQDDRKREDEKRATGNTPKHYGGTSNALSEIDKRIAKYQ